MARRALLVCSGIVLLLGIGYTIVSLTVPWGRPAQPGTGFFPFWVGVLISISSVMVAREALQMDRERQVEWPAGSAVRRVLLTSLSIASYGIVLVLLGHTVAGVVVAASLMRIMGMKDWRKLVPLSLAFGLGASLLFVEVLGVPLPAGRLLGLEWGG